jgi:hypothetical protein
MSAAKAEPTAATPAATATLIERKDFKCQPPFFPGAQGTFLPLRMLSQFSNMRIKTPILRLAVVGARPSARSQPGAATPSGRDFAFAAP